MKQGIVLIAHGSREPGWARPFERIAERLAEKLPDCAVRLAYLELMGPSLAEAVASLVAEGTRAIRVVPVFLGQGGHLKDDLPKLVAAARAEHPAIDVSLEPAIGEQPQVIDAIAAAITRPPTRTGS